MYHLDKVNGKLMGLPIYVNPYINGDGREVVVTPDGNYAYRSTANAGINVPMGVYNIADKSVSPTEIGRFYENTGRRAALGNGDFPMALSMSATVYDGFRIYDLATFSSLLVAYVAHPSIHDISLDYTNKILYVRDFIEDSSISAYDMSDPYLPSLVDCYYFPNLEMYNCDTGVHNEAQTGDLWYSEGYIYRVFGYDLVILHIDNN